MTRAQWTILVHLERQPGLLQKELAEILEVEPITVARLIDRLEARAMVERRPDPMDRRCWRLHLTQAARPLLGEVDEQLTDIGRHPLPRPDRRHPDHGRRPPFPACATVPEAQRAASPPLPDATICQEVA